MTPRETAMVLSATVRVLRDSTRTADIRTVADITSRRRFEQLLERERRSAEGRALLRERPEIDETHLDFEALHRLPADTLGGAYARHLVQYDLQLFIDTTSDVPVRDPDVRYLIHRYRQTHDIWHALLGLGTAGYEEVLVHAFTLGLLRLPISALVVALGTVKHIVLERRWDVLTTGLRAAYDSGRGSAPLLAVRWEQHWAEPLTEVRQRFGIASLEWLRRQ
ncbi:MAG: ubiquinone biosynthesis protein COQ4 [Deltaproteobacteria bacterium]|nr:ubiquinone biosynthesis protein COQ4 [Deltaproteobacteria bacterium]